MTPSSVQRVRRILAASIAPAALLVVAVQSAAAALPPDNESALRSPPQVPDGYVQLVDDTNTIAVVVPTTWSDVDTAPDVNDDGSPRPYISAAPDFEQFQSGFDVPGVLFAAFTFESDPQVLIDLYGLSAGCQAFEVQPYQDPVFIGLVQIGTNCGSAGAATWNMIIASPADRSFTAVVQLQSATAADQAAFDVVLDTFNSVAPGAEAPVPAPTEPSALPDNPAGPASSAPVAGPAPATATGSTELFDDTGTLTVVVPDNWTDIETAFLDFDGGLRRIAAAPDLSAFQLDADAAGLNLIAQPFAADTQSLVDQYSRMDSCQQSQIDDFDNGRLAGLAWTGSGCGPSAAGTWLLIVASPPDESVTFRVAVRTATAEDEQAVDVVLETFGLSAPGSVAAAVLPLAALPDAAQPTEVVTAFVEALAAGDGSAACALLSPEDVSNFNVGIRYCSEALTSRVAGQSVAWDAVEIVGEVLVESDTCGTSDAAEGYASVELAIAEERGCASLAQVGGAWRLEDFSNSIWNGAADF